MKRAKSGVIRGARFAQADIPLDDLYDVGLLLDGLGEVGHEVGCIEDKAERRDRPCEELARTRAGIHSLEL
jgi:hypothetical protein